MSKKKAWIWFIISLIVCILVIVFSYKIKDDSISKVLMIISFFVSSILLQVALSKTLQFKKKDETIINSYYFDKSILESNLRENKFNSTKTSYGKVFIKVEGTQAYKVIVIEDCDKYVKASEEKIQSKSVKGLSECTTFIGLEIFLELDETISERINNFSFQSEKIYYQALYMVDDYIVEPNYITPEPQHIESYKYMHDILQFNKIDGE